MARISDITMKEQPEYNTLTIRKTINFITEFGKFTGDSFKKIMDYLNCLGVLVSEGPIVCFHNMDLERLDVEAGFPVAKPIKGKGDILANVIPMQKVVSAIDLGDYEKQDPTLEELFSWIQKHGCKPKGEIYYQYLNDTNRPVSEYLTKMVITIQ